MEDSLSVKSVATEIKFLERMATEKRGKERQSLIRLNKRLLSAMELRNDRDARLAHELMQRRNLENLQPRHMNFPSEIRKRRR